MEKVLVTGAAGFIGFHIARRLLKEGHPVVGVDNINSYYSPELKYDRLNILKKSSRFSFHKVNISRSSALENVFAENDVELVYHLAAQAGVRYSLEHPEEYIQSNLEGFANILECCRNHPVKHLVFASSSSVYGLNTKQPYSVDDRVDHPVSLYAATKKSNELMAHSYANLYNLPVTGLRFFTVYGPWGRPDMAYFKFVRQISNGEVIDIYNEGDMSRDFTYIDDIVESLYRLRNNIPGQNPEWKPETGHAGTSKAPYRIFNIGNNEPVHLMEFVDVIQEELDMEATINFMPMQPGDVKETWADSSELYQVIDYTPSTSIREGISSFVNWYKQYYRQEVVV